MLQQTNGNKFGLDFDSRCCQGKKIGEILSAWPEKFKDDEQKEVNIDIILKFLENKIRVSAINYKISSVSGKCSAF